VGGARGGLVPLALDEGGDDRAAREPGPLELGQDVATGEQAADAGRPAEHLVEGQGDEVGVPATEVEPVGGDVGGGVEEHVPAVGVRLLDPLERMLDAGEVRLRRIGEQVVVLAADLGQVAGKQLRVDAQVGRLARHVGRLGAAGARELADPVDGVVVVEGEQEAVTAAERVRLADQAQRAGRVRGEDRDVLVRCGAEGVEHGCTHVLDQLGHRRRGRVERVRVAKDVRSQQLDVLGEL
jgi:hypothetical protein